MRVAPQIVSPRFHTSLFAICMVMCLAIIHVPVATAADPAPEVKREPYPPAANGVVHTIRIIPETCAYLHGMFTGEKDLPYRYGAKRSAKRCQPRAQLVDPASVAPSVASGWILNDIVRVPSAACPSQIAVVRIWRKPVGNALPPPDAQGQSRIYLEESKQRAAQGKLATVPKYVAKLTLEGNTCP
jgi:hypothetical protein